MVLGTPWPARAPMVLVLEPVTQGVSDAAEEPITLLLWMAMPVTLAAERHQQSQREFYKSYQTPLEITILRK